MDIRNVKTFVRVAELKNFTRAAAELGYVQSTVTMQVQQLEKELGYPLFDRIGKTVSLTALGEEFLRHAYEVLHAVEQAEQLGNKAAEVHGTLRVGVSESLMFGVLMHLLPRFRATHPTVDISLKIGHSVELIEQLKHNQLDMLYISAEKNTDPAIHSYYTCRNRVLFLCSPRHPLAARRHISVRELMTYDFLVTEHEGSCSKRLYALAAQYGAAVNAIVEMDSVYVITELVKRNMGLAFLPEYAVLGPLKDGSLLGLDVDVPPQPCFGQVLCHKGRWVPPFMSDLIELIREAQPEVS